MQRANIAKWLLITSLVFVFGTFGIDKFVHPIFWIGWMPEWMNGLLGLMKDQWLQIIGALEIFFALLLLIPLRRVRQTGVILILMHCIGILTQTGWNDIAIRDIGLMGAGIALLALL